MSDDLTPIPNVSVERNVRQLIDILATYPEGATTEDLRRQFELETGLGRQSYYNTLAAAKTRQWIVSGDAQGKLNVLSPDGSWKPPPRTYTGVVLERDRLEHVANVRNERIEELERLIEDVADNGSIAVASLVRIVGDSSITTPRRLKAAGIILGYRVQSDEVVGLAKRYLESLCGNDTPLGHRIEAAELLQKHGSPKVMQPIERPARAESVETAEARAERRQRQEEVYRRKVEHMERVRAANAVELERERAAGLIPDRVR
jgi:hypothetical protein